MQNTSTLGFTDEVNGFRQARHVKDTKRNKWQHGWQLRVNELKESIPKVPGAEIDFGLKTVLPNRVMNVQVSLRDSEFEKTSVIQYSGRTPSRKQLLEDSIDTISDLSDRERISKVDELVGKIHNEDCLKTLEKIPNESVQVVFADPPFNVNKKYNSYEDNMDEDSYWKWTKLWLVECLRVLRKDGALFLYNIPRHLVKSVVILNDLAKFQHWIAWNSVGKPLGRSLQLAHYGILYYNKSENHQKFYDVRAPHKICRKCESYLKDYGGKEHMRHPFGTLVSDVWDDLHRVRHANKRISNHPCQLPVHLLERILLISSDVDDVVFDPFCGGGSMAVAAKQLKRKYIGSEIDAEYTNASNQKMQNAKETKLGSAYVSTHLSKIITVRDMDLSQFENVSRLACSASI